MTSSPLKAIFTLSVCCLTLLNTTGAAHACWLTDWLWGHNDTPAPVAPPVITTGYAAYPQTVSYAPAVAPAQQVNYQAATCAPPAATTAGYLPQTVYRSQYQQVPVTVYRPVPVYQANSPALPSIAYQGCTTSRTQVQRVPALGYAPAAGQTAYDCAPAGYYAPASPSVSGAPAVQPGNWVPRTESTVPSAAAPPAAGAYQYSAPAQGYPQQAPMSGYSQAAPAQGVPMQGNVQQGSIYGGTQPNPSTSPSDQMPPAEQRPALRPQVEGPQLGGSNNNGYGGGYYQNITPSSPNGQSNDGASSNGNYPNGQPAQQNGTSNGSPGGTDTNNGEMSYQRRIVPPTITGQRPPQPTTPAVPSATSPWKVAPVTPIPDPEFSSSGPQDEAPRLLDPRDRTAGLNQTAPIVPVSYAMETSPPQNVRPAAQNSDTGWHSVAP